MDTELLLTLTSNIVSAHVGANPVGIDDVPRLVRDTYAALAALGSADKPQQLKPTPAVSIRASTSSQDHILSLIDGKPYKSLKRHLARHGYTPESYRTAFGLPPSYPMVAEGYSATRREMARQLGLGQKKSIGPGRKVGAAV